ncbi:MAG: glycosyl transferase family 39 [Phycisphaerales bacterium]|nr:glycosyl transferase family 39 [Phycisphaerales bacterium]
MKPCWALISLIVISAAVRFGVPRTPPGMHIDEASNAWNAFCISQTMFDEHRVMLPLLYTRAFNDNRSPMYLYLAAPFEAALGPVDGVRIPAQLSGIAATLLLWQLVRRLAGERAGLIAGLLWALDPTFAQYTRWGHEASITPMLVLASLCLWQRAGLLWAKDDASDKTLPPAKPLRWAFAAGLISGFACYGYAAIRLYLPCLLLASVLADRRQWTRAAGRRWLAAAIGFALFFGPLAYVHVTDPAINERGRQSWTWDAGDSVPVIAFKLAARYVAHFDPRFLFIHGTADELLTTLAPPPPFGALPWLWAIPVALGVWVVCRTACANRLAKLAAVALLIYPAGDVLNALGGPNVLRSLSGWWCFALLGTVAIEWIATRTRSQWVPKVAVASTAFCTAAALPNIILLLLRWGTEPQQQLQRGVDFQQACAIIEPKLRVYDAVIFTSTDTPYAYAQILCYLNYRPETFLTEPMMRAMVIDTKRNAPDLLARTGKLYFLRAMSEVLPAIDEGIVTGMSGKSLWVLRPSDPWRSPTDKLIETIRLPDGTPSLLLLEHTRDAGDR